MENEETKPNMSDHDAIITLVADVHNLRKSQDIFHTEIKGEFKDLKDNYSLRINKLEEIKLDKVEHHDHEERLRVVERSQENLLGKLSVVAVVVSIGVTLLTSWLKTKI